MQKVLLYYKYTKIDDPQKLCEDQKKLCRSLGIKGRILIADEGINGTIAGTEKAIDEYIERTSEVEGFGDIEWKVSFSDHPRLFPKLRVVVRPEVVTLGLRSKAADVSLQNSAEYIEPEELLQMYENNEEFYILDARNEYESRIGKFKNAITVPAENFRELPQKLDEISNLKDKPVVTYCTGGIRCEKFSALLKEHGFQNVKQLHGGIHNYSDRTGGKNFQGEMYVFDGRVHIKVNEVDPEVISKCHHCRKEVARYINCCNAECNLQFICCEVCDQEFGSGCSRECQKLSRFK